MSLYKLAKTEVTKQFCASTAEDEVITPQMVSSAIFSSLKEK